MKSLIDLTIKLLSVSFLGILIILYSCSKDDDEKSDDGPSTIVKADAATYTEANESGNNSHENAEDISYTLDDIGMIISGSFESSDPSNDYYKFNTSTFGRMSVQVFIDGVRQESLTNEVNIHLNAFEDDGYSTLTGDGYFINAWIQPDMEYVISITGAEGRNSYRMEIIGGDSSELYGL